MLIKWTVIALMCIAGAFAHELYVSNDGKTKWSSYLIGYVVGYFVAYFQWHIFA